MSSKPQHPQSTGSSKSAAKKKQKQPQQPSQSSSAPQPPSSIPDPLDPAFFSFQSQSPYPIDVQFDDSYYDQLDVPLPLPPGATFPGGVGGAGYSIDYNLSLQNGSQLAGLSAPFNITHDDLISAANELYKRMADPDFGSDDAYWQGLPLHLKQFIRDAVPFSGSINSGTPGGTTSQRTMYQMAQQIVQAASQGMGLGGQGISPNLINGNSRPPFPMPTQAQAQSISEELGFHRHPDATKDDDLDEEDELGDEIEHHIVNGDAPKKKNKKKKKKSTAQLSEIPAPPTSSLPSLPPPATLPRGPVRAPAPAPAPIPAPTATPTTAQAPTPQPPALNPPPPPAPVPTPTPPSSRAAGKQPMSNAPTSNPPTRSARAAGKAPATAAPPSHGHSHNHAHAHNHPPSKPSSSTVASAPGKGKAPAAPPAKIWTQSSLEDRQNIRQFWLGLTEAERRDLLRIEKDAVLKKMKEQHRHSCGCAVCGRKKVNIEMELDQLYEQYYDELRSYAAEQRTAANGLRPPVAGAGPFPGSVEVDSSGTVTQYDHRAPAEDDPEDPDEESEEYDEEYEEDDEDLDDDDIGTDEADVGDDEDDHNSHSHGHSHGHGHSHMHMHDHAHDHPPAAAPPVSHRQPRAPAKPPVREREEGADDFLSFGSNLATIKGGILTIADDMLKNDGSKFLEMMEQLAIRRSVREEQNLREMGEETDEEDDDESRDEPLTDKERAEEGKRMFQIFAARMFEQRVLQAYRERVAKQREEQLLRELEEEEDSKRAKEEKKAKEAQKKKDKKKAQKQKAEEERLTREAVLEEERLQAKLRREEEQRDRLRKQEEERARREAVKRAAQEEVQKQALERKRRQQEEKEREEEAVRKKKEREEKAKKEREAREKEQKEKERKEREARAAKEQKEKDRKAKEKAEKAERERVARETREKAEKDRQAKLETDRAEQARKEEAARKEREAAEQAKLAAQKAQREKTAAEKAEKAAARAAQAASAPGPAPILTGLRSPSKGPTPRDTPPISHPSPIRAARAGSSSTPARQTQKTPTTYQSQPIPSVGISSFQRMPMPPGYGPPGLRQAYANQSPAPQAFSPPRTNGSTLSPNAPQQRAFADPSPPFDHGIRTAPIGMGFPPAKPTSRIPLAEDTFPPATAAIGMPASRSLSNAGIGSTPGEIATFGGSMPLDEYRQVPAPIAPIGRPNFSSSSPATGPSAALRPLSPTPPEQVFGSAALGGDDEIVQPQQRRPTATWDMPTAPGAGRWSASPSIWGGGAPGAVAGVAAGAGGAVDAWGAAPGVGGIPAIGERAVPPGPPGLSLSPGSVPGGQRQPSFGGIGSAFGGVGVGAIGGMGGIGALGPHGAPGGGAPGSGYSQGLFSPQHQSQHPHSSHQS